MINSSTESQNNAGKTEKVFSNASLHASINPPWLLAVQTSQYNQAKNNIFIKLFSVLSKCDYGQKSKKKTQFKIIS